MFISETVRDRAKNLGSHGLWWVRWPKFEKFIFFKTVSARAKRTKFWDHMEEKKCIFWDNGQFTFPRPCELEGSCDPKINNFTSCNCVGSSSAGFIKNLFCFVLSLTISKKTAILTFFKKLAENWPPYGCS